MLLWGSGNFDTQGPKIIHEIQEAYGHTNSNSSSNYTNSRLNSTTDQSNIRNKSTDNGLLSVGFLTDLIALDVT